MSPGDGSAAPKDRSWKAEERRFLRRTKRRLMVRYGVGKCDRTAFTKNVSESGIFIQTNGVYNPGTTIQVEIHFPDRTFSHWGRVVWARQVPAQLAHILECGMGVCFIEPGADWLEYYRDWARKNGLE